MNRPVLETIMSLDSICSILQGEVLSGEEQFGRTISGIAATDMMSQVLASSRPGTVLLTGLTNVQVINTAEVAGLGGVVFVQGLRPPDPVIQKAQILGLPTMLTPHTLYTACGLLFSQGYPSL
jgi:hypothetical protein